MSIISSATTLASLFVATPAPPSACSITHAPCPSGFDSAVSTSLPDPSPKVVKTQRITSPHSTPTLIFHFSSSLFSECVQLTQAPVQAASEWRVQAVAGRQEA
ncbi:unnamed protein product [Closterium sp. NIES-54]